MAGDADERYSAVLHEVRESVPGDLWMRLDDVVGERLVGVEDRAFGAMRRALDTIQYTLQGSEIPGEAS